MNEELHPHYQTIVSSYGLHVPEELHETTDAEVYKEERESCQIQQEIRSSALMKSY